MLWIMVLLGMIVGVFGAMMGVGGGILLIPILTGIFDIPIKTSVAASIICVVATSCGASVSYLQKELTHIRLAMTLETATVAGALAGGITAVWMDARWLTIIFGCVLIYAFYSMQKFKGSDGDSRPTGLLDAEYIDPVTKETVAYGVRNLWAGLGLSFIAGNISGLLGVGGGIVKTPVMNLMMGVPLRAAIATSNFMIGITAATGALVYFAHGLIDPALAAPITLGVLAGSRMGARLGSRIKSRRLKQMFQALLLVFAVQMFIQAFRGRS